MIVKPNKNARISESRQKNDLFRKFKDYFIGATEKEFNQFDHYGKDGYISIDPILEEKITDILNHNIDEILPITGSTGIGKTYLLLYCLKTYYNIEHIETNHPELFLNEDSGDLVYYSDFNITEPSLLDNPSNLILAKVQAMYERITAHFGIKESDIDNYVQNHKLEAKFYPKADIIYQNELFRLTTLLKNDTVKIKNIIFIFDDLESLDEQQQFSLMKHFLTLFENFKSKSNGKYHSKFLFCLRSNTYYNIYKRDFYNTHRVSKACCLSVAPSLSQVFNKRFEIILKSDQVQKAKNATTWKEARDILIRICERVDSSYSDMLIKLNNNNVSNALDDFLNIVSNRRWTQKNVNPTASFVIEENQYYINDINILRILSMGEQNVYYQTTTMPIRCILPNPGACEQDDLISFLVLRAFEFNTIPIPGNITSSKQLSEDDIAEQIIDCLLSYQEENYESKKKHIIKTVAAAFEYYEENRFIKKNVDPELHTEEIKFFILPRGEQTFNLFFSQSILFTIFRDTYILDSNKYDVRCSNYMGFSNLLTETLKYEKQLLYLEVRFFNKITENKMWRNYVSFWGPWCISEQFLGAIYRSLQQFYKDNEIPNNILEQLEAFKKDVNVLTMVFKNEFEENALF